VLCPACVQQRRWVCFHLTTYSARAATVVDGVGFVGGVAGLPEVSTCTGRQHGRKDSRCGWHGEPRGRCCAESFSTVVDIVKFGAYGICSMQGSAVQHLWLPGSLDGRSSHRRRCMVPRLMPPERNACSRAAPPHAPMRWCAVLSTCMYWGLCPFCVCLLLVPCCFLVVWPAPVALNCGSCFTYFQAQQAAGAGTCWVVCALWGASLSALITV
jgi:hypothetical protein